MAHFSRAHLSLVLLHYCMVKDGYFRHFYFHWRAPHLFDLALILFYLEVVVEEFSWKACCSWRATRVACACMYLVSFLYLEILLGGRTCGRFPLAIFRGFILEEHTLYCYLGERTLEENILIFDGCWRL
jgi:hypothetical protein